MPGNVRKTVKFSLLILGITVVLLMLAPFFIDAGNFKPMIARQAEQAIGRQVEIGDISASLFPWVGVRLEDVKIANREGFSSQPFLTIKSLDVEMALLPLFSKRIEIRRFVLESPHLTLERNSEGVGNWQNEAAAGFVPPVTGSPPPAKAVPAPASPGPAGFALAALTAEAVSIHHGELSWNDAATGSYADISSLELAMDSVRLDSPIPVRLTGRIGDSGFSLEGQLGPVRDFSAMDMARLPVQAHLKAKGLTVGAFAVYVPQLAPYHDLVFDIDAKFEQRPDGLRLSAGTAHMTMGRDIAVHWKLEAPSAGKTMLRSVRLTVDGEEAAQVRGRLQPGKDGIEYEIRLSTPALSRKMLMTWFPRVDTLYAGHTTPWQHLKLGMLFSGNAKHLDLRDFQLLLDGELVQASGIVRFGDSPDIRLRIAAGMLHISPWIPAPKRPRIPSVTTEPVQSRPDQDQAGTLITPSTAHRAAVISDPEPVISQRKAVASIPADAGDVISRELVQGDMTGTPEPDLRFLAAWRVAAQVQVEQLFLHGLELKHVRANLTGKRGKFELAPLTFELSGGQVREHTTLNVARYPVRWTESSVATGVRLRPVISALTGRDLLSGVAEVNLNLTGSGLLPDAALNTLSGTGNIRVRDGQVHGFDVPGMLRRLRMLGRDTGPKLTEFSQLVGSFVINNGVVKNDDLFMASPRFRLTGHGRIDLTRQSMDYHIRPRLIGAATGQGDTAGVRKGMTVPIHLVGPIASPMVKLEMNIQDLMENVQGVINEIRKDGGAKGVRKVLEGLLPNL